MPKFKDKVIKKYFAGSPENQFREYDKRQYNKLFTLPALRDIEPERPKSLTEKASHPSTKTPISNFLTSILNQRTDQATQDNTNATLPMVSAPKAVNKSATKSVNSKKPVAPVANVSPADILKRQTELELNLSQQGMGIAPDNLTNAMSAYKKQTTPTIPDIGKSIKEGIKSSVATPDMAKAAGELPKTKSGMKKFMDEYGKFIALGALAGTGGKGGAIAAPIMAALPGILKMLQDRGKKTTDAPAAPASNPSVQVGMAHGGSMGNKFAAHPKKKMVGGTVRKFKGGSMNTMKENLMPKYKKGGDMPKGMPKEMMAMMGKMQKGNTLRRNFGGLSGIPQNTGTGPAMGIMGMDQPMKGQPMQPQIGAKGMPMGMNNPQAGFSSANTMDPQMRAKGMPMGMKNPDNYSLIKKMKMMGPMAAGVPSVALPRRRAGGAIRKFEGGTMNSMDNNFTPSYKKGGAMPKGMMDMMGKKGKATGDMPEHKKMDMGMPIGKMPDSKKMGMAKPKPSSMDQKFAKGGTARYASGGMCKGYGMAKKIRPTGSMN